MRIVAFETLDPRHPLDVWVRLHTDEGLVGLGESASQPAVAARAAHNLMQCIPETREAVGADVDVAIEGHGLWNVPSAIRIARALESYDPL